MIDIAHFLSSIRVKLLHAFPWYGHVLMQLPVVCSHEMTTLGVGKHHAAEVQIKLYVNPDYVNHIITLCRQDEFRVQEHFFAVCKHEVLHLLFGHLTLDLKHNLRQTIACELAVNSYLERQMLVKEPDEKVPGIFPEDYRLPTKLSAREYYHLLATNKIFLDSLARNPGKRGIFSIIFGKQTACGKPLDDHQTWQAAGKDSLTPDVIADVIRKANEACIQEKSWGLLSADIKAIIKRDYLDRQNVIPWPVILRNFLASAADNMLDYTIKRKSRRYGTRPGTRKIDLLNAAIAIDTSGSISTQLLKVFFTELEWMAKTSVKLTVFEWDTKINREYDFRDFDGTVSGRGGTDPIPVLEEVSNRRFDCLIIFTDLQFDEITNQYDIPTLWVVEHNARNSLRRNGGRLPISHGIVLEINP